MPTNDLRPLPPAVQEALHGLTETLRQAWPAPAAPQSPSPAGPPRAPETPGAPVFPRSPAEREILAVLRAYYPLALTLHEVRYRVAVSGGQVGTILKALAVLGTVEKSSAMLYRYKPTPEDDGVSHRERKTA